VNWPAMAWVMKAEAIRNVMMTRRDRMPS
jgi:hypothetical protein